MIGLVAVRSSAVEANPVYQAAVAAQKEKLKKKQLEEEKKAEVAVLEKVKAKKLLAPKIKLMANIKSEPSEIRKLITKVAKKYGTTYEEVISTSRKMHVINARDEAVELVHIAFPKLSMKGIGMHFGNRFHTTITSSLKKRGVK